MAAPIGFTALTGLRKHTIVQSSIESIIAQISRLAKSDGISLNPRSPRTVSEIADVTLTIITVTPSLPTVEWSVPARRDCPVQIGLQHNDAWQRSTEMYAGNRFEFWKGIFLLLFPVASKRYRAR